MTATPYDGADWPATISVGPGWYGLRLPQEYGTIVEYVGPRDLVTSTTRCTCRRVSTSRTEGYVAVRTVAPPVGPCPVHRPIDTTAGPALGAER